MADSTIFPVAKLCHKCGEVKPFTEFHKNKSNRDGLQSHCKACFKLYRQANADKDRENIARWRANNIDHVREYRRQYEDTHKNFYREYFHEYRQKNKARINARQRKYQRRPERIAAAQTYRRNNPDVVLRGNHHRRTRLKGNGGRFTARDVANMRYIQQGHCCYCGRLGQRLHLDHIIPVKHGGPSDPWNLALCCKSCNSSKGYKSLDEWVDRWYLG